MKKQILVIFMFFALVGMTVAKSKSKSVEQLVPLPSNEENSVQPISIVNEFEGLAKKLVGAAADRPTFAFMALTSDDGNALVENYVTDALTEAMFVTGKIKIVERTSLEKIMSEQQFQSSAFVNENTAAEIGNLSGADFVCYGTLRDLQNQISVSVRVVEVSTAELYAMSRDTVEKDVYLVNVGFERRKEDAKILLPKTIGGSSAESVVTNTVEEEELSTPKPKVDTLWQVQKKGNAYTFSLKSSDIPFLFMGYNKNENSSNSFVRAGIHWRNHDISPNGGWDIKETGGNIIKRNYRTGYWTYGGESFNFSYNTGESARFFVDLFGNNNVLTVRHDNESFRFKCEGFWQAVEEQGLTREEIYDAIANEEF